MTANKIEPKEVHSNKAEPSNNFSRYNLASSKNRREMDIDQITHNHESLKVLLPFQLTKICLVRDKSCRHKQFTYDTK